MAESKNANKNRWYNWLFGPLELLTEEELEELIKEQQWEEIDFPDYMYLKILEPEGVTGNLVTLYFPERYFPKGRLKMNKALENLPQIDTYPHSKEEEEFFNAACWEGMKKYYAENEVKIESNFDVKLAEEIDERKKAVEKAVKKAEIVDIIIKGIEALGEHTEGYTRLLKADSGEHEKEADRNSKDVLDWFLEIVGSPADNYRRSPVRFNKNTVGHILHDNPEDAVLKNEIHIQPLRGERFHKFYKKILTDMAGNEKLKDEGYVKFPKEEVPLKKLWKAIPDKIKKARTE